MTYRIQATPSQIADLAAGRPVVLSVRMEPQPAAHTAVVTRECDRCGAIVTGARPCARCAEEDPRGRRIATLTYGWGGWRIVESELHPDHDKAPMLRIAHALGYTHVREGDRVYRIPRAQRAAQDAWERRELEKSCPVAVGDTVTMQCRFCDGSGVGTYLPGHVDETDPDAADAVEFLTCGDCGGKGTLRAAVHHIAHREQDGIHFWDIEVSK